MIHPFSRGRIPPSPNGILCNYSISYHTFFHYFKHFLQFSANASGICSMYDPPFFPKTGLIIIDYLLFYRLPFTLSIEKKQAIKASDKGKSSTGVRIQKVLRNKEKILDYLKDNGRSSCFEIAVYIGLSKERTRALLSEMEEVEPIGGNRNRTYRIK